MSCENKHKLSHKADGIGNMGTITPTCSCGWSGFGVAAYNDDQHSKVRDQGNRHLCEEFNAACPIGGAVTVKLDGVDEPFETVTRSAAQILSGHTPVVWLEGVSGCYLLERVTPKSQVHA